MTKAAETQAIRVVPSWCGFRLDASNRTASPSKLTLQIKIASKDQKESTQVMNANAKKIMGCASQRLELEDKTSFQQLICHVRCLGNIQPPLGG